MEQNDLTEIEDIRFILHKALMKEKSRILSIFQHKNPSYEFWLDFNYSIISKETGEELTGKSRHLDNPKAPSMTPVPPPKPDHLKYKPIAPPIAQPDPIVPPIAQPKPIAPLVVQPIVKIKGVPHMVEGAIFYLHDENFFGWSMVDDSNEETSMVFKNYFMKSQYPKYKQQFRERYGNVIAIPKFVHKVWKVYGKLTSEQRLTQNLHIQWW